MEDNMNLLISLAVTAALVVASPTTALKTAQSDPSTQQRIVAIMEETPGGIQTGPNEVSWDGGRVILTFSSEMMPRATSCAAGKYCLFSKANFLGDKLSFTGCSATKVNVALPSVRSASNARTTGTVRGYNGSTQTLTVSPGVSINTTATIKQVSCS